MSGADPSSVPRNVGQGQRVGLVPFGLFADVHAAGRGQSEPLFRFDPDSSQTDTCRSTSEGVRSRRGDARSFREGLRGDPCVPE